MEQAFEMVENLTQELAEKEDKIIKLEKELKKIKKEYKKIKTLFGECDNHLHFIVQGQIEEQWHFGNDEYPEDNEAYEISIGLDELICDYMLPSSVEIWNEQNLLRLREGWIIKHYKNRCDRIYIQMKDKDLKDLNIIS